MITHSSCLARRSVLTTVLLVTAAAGGQPVLYVDDDASLGGDGASWNTAFRYLRDAIIRAQVGDVGEIRVAEGIYSPDDTESCPGCPPDPALWFFVPDTPFEPFVFSGGYAGASGSDPDDRDVFLYETVLSGNIEDDLNQPNTFSNNVFRIGGIPDEYVEIDGFTIRDGNARGVGGLTRGGGIRHHAGGAVIRRCTFVHNMANSEGAAIWSDNPLTIDRCLFAFNESAHGGALSAGSVVRATNSVFACNVANATNSQGGAVRINSDSAMASYFINCTFYSNSASNGGGSSIFNGAVDGATVFVYNSYTRSVYQVSGASTFMDYSVVGAGPGVEVGDDVFELSGPLDLFVDPDNPDYHLIDFGINAMGDAAPLLDAGNNAEVPLDTPKDYVGNPRVVDGDGDDVPVVDIGAYEHVPGCPLCPGARVWTGDGTDQSFETIENWDIGPPGPSNSAFFSVVPDTYTVEFNSDATVNRLEIQQGDVTFQLNGRFMDVMALGNSVNPPFIVGNPAGGAATLHVYNGELTSHGAVLGQVADSSGHLYVGPGAMVGVGSLAFGGEVRIGAQGTGMLTVTDEGQSFTALLSDFMATIGELPTVPAAALVSGPDARWESFLVLNVKHGTLTLEDGAVVSAGFGTIIFPNGAIEGSGTIEGTVFNIGELSPGNSIGTITIDGEYRQIGEDNPLLGTGSGSLNIEVGGVDGAEHDQLVVTNGAAMLGGGLFVQVSGIDPGLDDSFPIVTAPVIEGGFDVAFMPGLNDRFMQLSYSGAGPGSQTAVIEVTSLASLFGFDPTNPVPAGGVPTDVDVGDFDDDGDEDLAITVLGATLAHNGFVVVLLNGGFDGGTGDWIIEDVVQKEVGREPSGVAFAFLDADGNLDVAVSNLGDDNVYVLRGSGNGSFDPTPVIIPVGDQPSDVAAADFDEDANGDVDLLVANAGDDNMLVLTNDGDAAFVLQAMIPTGGSPFAVDPSDLDNDKDADAVAACLSSDTLTVALNQAGGIFGTPDQLNVGDAPVALAAADFDGNGFTDLVTANRGDGSGGAGTVSVVLNNGAGQFQPAVNLPVGDLARSLTAIDLEGDGDSDIAVVVTNTSDQRVVQVLRNDLTGGQLIFAPAEELAAGENPALVATGDLDGVSGDDLVTVSEDPVALPGLGPPTPGSVRVRLSADPVSCPWDCGDEDTTVGIGDFLALLAEWGQGGAPCDFGLGPPGVGIDEFLALLAAWGPCP